MAQKLIMVKFSQDLMYVKKSAVVGDAGKGSQSNHIAFKRPGYLLPSKFETISWI